MISKVKERIFGLINRRIMFRYNGTRNQIDEFSGKIIRCYNHVFLIDIGGMNRSFSYSDVLTGVLEVDI